MSDFIVPPCREALRILYQDEHCLFIDKPSGLLSVPGRHPANRDSVASRLQQDFPEAHIVHRLDMDTSGVMVIALNVESHRFLSRQFQERRSQKRYEAIVSATPTPEQGSVDLPLICDWPNRPLQKVDHELGKPSLTHYETTGPRQDGAGTRVVLTPHTGRSHQLRVHMAAIGCPILGDSFYAPKVTQEAAPRLLLHASELSIDTLTGPHRISCLTPF